jgi:hypothetical protein
VAIDFDIIIIGSGGAGTHTEDLPDMQPRDITMEMVRRISTACDDCDSMDSFG